jgi:hypothetical protein
MGIATWSFREASTLEPARPRLLDRVRQAHMSRRTEEAYVAWIRRYILFHHKRHPAKMGAPEITKFLTSLAVDGSYTGMCWRSTSVSPARCRRDPSDLLYGAGLRVLEFGVKTEAERGSR